jgi:serine O-acetyltransferase
MVGKSATKRSAFSPTGAVTVDPIWRAIRDEANAVVEAEPVLTTFVYSAILDHDRLEDAVIARIASRLHSRDIPGDIIRHKFDAMADADPEWSDILRIDIAAVYDRDPACDRLIEPILYFKGFHAIQTHRLAHWSWNQGHRDFAYYLQSRSSQVFQTDINPAARMGRGIFMDHATGVVIGATAVIGDNVSMLHGVTLGGTGKESGDRHPKIGSGVLLGAGAKVLGNIRVGNCSRIAAGSLVLKDVPDKVTVAGVPGKIVGVAGCAEPARTMDQIIADVSGNR